MTYYKKTLNWLKSNKKTSLILGLIAIVPGGILFALLYCLYLIAAPVALEIISVGNKD